jgi:enoyl-[acyl-carrier protein] reductase II
VHGTVATSRIDGLPARVVDAAGARRIIGRPLNPVSALFKSREIARMLGFPWPKLALGILLGGWRKSTQMMRMAVGFEAFRRGTTVGDTARGVLPLGQVTGLLDDTPTVAELMDRIVREAEAATARVDASFQPGPRA